MKGERSSSSSPANWKKIASSSHRRSQGMAARVLHWLVWSIAVVFIDVSPALLGHHGLDLPVLGEADAEAPRAVFLRQQAKEGIYKGLGALVAQARPVVARLFADDNLVVRLQACISR